MSEVKALQGINQAKKGLAKGNDLKEDMAMVMAPYANWEEFLTPAPITICLLGELMLISTTRDFTLEKKPPKDGFKLLRNPGSFRACLVQVGNYYFKNINKINKKLFIIVSVHLELASVRYSHKIASLPWHPRCSISMSNGIKILLRCLVSIVCYCCILT